MPILLILVVGAWYFVFRHPDKRKKLSSSVLNNVRALLSKENRTALVIAIGAIGIVLAIVLGTNQLQNAGKKVIRARTYREGNLPYLTHKCPNGYRNGGDGFCYPN